MIDYQKFLERKKFKDLQHGFNPLWIPDFLYPFQKHLIEWTLRKGRSALFEDCGLGKTPQQLVWAENIVRKTNKRVLILTPLAVSHQTLREADKFSISAKRSIGKLGKGIHITNYERLKSFSPKDFIGVVADESGILKCFDGKTRRLITEFVQTIPYRLLCTATPAPNDFMELGSSSEALGLMTYNQMLAMFFTHKGDTTGQWVLKGHSKVKFWQWMSLWARALRKPSDLGYQNEGFNLPELSLIQVVVESENSKNTLFPTAARTLNEQRQERRDTIQSRCEEVLKHDPKTRPYLCWCHLNSEGDLLEKLLSDAIQVSGSDSDDYKESKLIDFSKGNIRTLITKPRIGGFGMNWQHCSNFSYFPSHSYEQFYQCVRRNWRFGQKRPVTGYIISSERESEVVSNMLRKERQSDEMYNGLIKEMSSFQRGDDRKGPTQSQKMGLPEWL